MDPPESPPSPAGRPSSADGWLYEVLHLQDSPIFDFINSLSPIATPKPLDSAPNVQLFKSPDLVPVSSIFTSPQVHPQKESKPGIRAGYVQLSQGLGPNCQRNEIEISSCIEMSGPSAIASGNSSPSVDAANLSSKWPQSILFGSETLGDAKKQDIDGKADHSANMGQVEFSSKCYDQNGVDKMDLSTSVRNVQENELDKQYNDDLAACSLSHQISYSSNVGGVMSKSGLSLEAHQLSWKLRNDHVIFSKSFIPMDQRTSEDSQTKEFDGPTGCYIQSAADDAHVHCAGAAAGVVMNHDPEMLPGVNQSQLVSNEYFVGTFEVPSDNVKGRYSSEVYIHDDHSTRKTMSNAVESSQESHKKKRRKVQDGDGDSCRSCSCKKSKCLKLMTLTKLLLRLDIKEAAIAGSLLALKNIASAFRYQLTCHVVFLT
nr:unnamed protein product [Digitaria exilis]